MTNISCIYCKKETSIRGIFTHYNHHHNPIWKSEWYDKNKVNGDLFAQRYAKLRNDKLESYNLNPNICVCGKPKSYKRKTNKYCSMSCATTHTNKTRTPRTEESRKKTSETLKKTISNKPKSIKEKTICKVSFKNCSQCGILFTIKSIRSNRKTCSRVCQIHASVGVRKYTNGRRKNIYYKHKDGSTVLLESSWELEIAEFMDKHNINWIRPKYIRWTDKDGKIRLYYPDFYLPDYDIYLDPKNPTAISSSIDKMEIVSKLIPLIYGCKEKIKLHLSNILGPSGTIRTCDAISCSPPQTE